MADDGESLESWLNKATNPSNRQEDWEYIMGFCDQVNKELEGPQISVRLLAYKIQSPQEWEALQALTVLEACMKNCGQRFHNEVGKFKFLNELIKVVSPKYLGDKLSEKVKTKIIEMLYCWTVSLPEEAKIGEAYLMLKSQGVVSVDPEISLDVTLTPSPRPKNPVFEDEKKSKKLAELLKSKKPEDLQEANRLIKSMVKEDEARTQKTTKQKSTLEAANNNVKLLSEMLKHFSREDSTEGDKELIRELYGDCDKLRETISQLAAETEDDDCSFGDMLQASDDLSHVINSFKRIVEGDTVNGETQQTQPSVQQGSSNQSDILIDLVGLDMESPSPPEQRPPQSTLSFSDELLCGAAATDTRPHRAGAPSSALSLLDEELLSLGLNEPFSIPTDSAETNPSCHLSFLQDSSQDLDLFGTNLPAAPASSVSSSSLLDALSTTVDPANATKPSTVASALSLPGPVSSAAPAAVTSTTVRFSQPLTSATASVAPAARTQSFITTQPAASVASQQVSTSTGVSHSPAAAPHHSLQDLALLDLGSVNNGAITSTTSTSAIGGGTQGCFTPELNKSQTDDGSFLRPLSPLLPLTQSSPAGMPDISLANVVVLLESIKPSNVCPVTAYDKNGVRVLLHFATDCPPGRPDVLVMVASMLNTSPQPVRNVVLQAAVPKTMKVKLQPSSGSELAPFNPILPPAVITQVMLLANPLQEKVRMKYKLTFTLGEQPLTEVGEVNAFPPADRWGAL